MTPKYSTPSVILTTAANRLNPQTWIKGMYSNGAGRYCAVGMLQNVARPGKFVEALAWADKAASKLTKKRDGGWIVDYNDAPRRKLAEVKKALRLAAKLAKKAGR